MRKLKLLTGFIMLLAFGGCDTENAFDCLQVSGDLERREYDLEVFKRITVWKRVKLIVSEGPRQKVVIEAGKNLFNELNIRVEDSILKVSDRNSCNFLRDYEGARVFVTSPNIDVIRNSSGLTVEGEGRIAWPRLELISEDRDMPDEFHIDGDFRFDELFVGNITVNANGLSTFYFTGEVISANFGIFDGDVRIEAADLIARNVDLFHRGTNKMIIYPVEGVRGTITGLGDVIARNQPPLVEVEELFTGRLIFE